MCERCGAESSLCDADVRQVDYPIQVGQSRFKFTPPTLSSTKRAFRSP